jgi:hypothetical protein
MAHTFCDVRDTQSVLLPVEISAAPVDNGHEIVADDLNAGGGDGFETCDPRLDRAGSLSPEPLDAVSQAAAGNGIFAAGDRRPKTCLRDETYAQRHKSRPHRSRKTRRKQAFPQAGLPRRVSVDWMVDAPGLELGTR